MEGAPGETVTGVREAVRAGGLFRGDGKVIVLLSGGRDSVCLLDVAVALRAPDSVSALHLNYGLRASAGAEQRHCEHLCEHLGVELSAVSPEHHPPGGAEPGNLQAWAREERYAAAFALARELEATGEVPVASGHTASDQVETILYRLAASPGRRALLGMAPSDRTRFGQRLIRPLLGITREQNGLRLDRAPFKVFAATEEFELVEGPRIGITKATDVPWRFEVAGSAFNPAGRTGTDTG